MLLVLSKAAHKSIAHREVAAPKGIAMTAPIRLDFDTDDDKAIVLLNR